MIPAYTKFRFAHWQVIGRVAFGAALVLGASTIARRRGWFSGYTLEAQFLIFGGVLIGIVLALVVPYLHWVGQARVRVRKAKGRVCLKCLYPFEPEGFKGVRCPECGYFNDVTTVKKWASVFRPYVGEGWSSLEE